MTRLYDAENDAAVALLRILANPAAAKAELENHLCRRAHISVQRAELETVGRQLAERERQVTARETNIRRREAALRTKK
jgi:hypothetical protein